MTKDIALKAACADTFYYPPEWNPSRGTLDHFQRRKGFEHHFGKQRTKNLHRGILQIRFEMPFKVQCLRCQTYIGQGTRYDADKKKVGKYFSTSIYEFAMHCGTIVGHERSVDGRVFCNQRMVIRTDPKNADYELVEGIRRKVETWDPTDAETTSFVDPETRRKMEADPMFKKEQTLTAERRDKSEKQRMSDLTELQHEREDTYELNCLLRRRNRVLRKQEEAEAEAERLNGKPNFAVPLAPPLEDDARQAAAVVYRTDLDKVEVAARRAAAAAAPLFKRPRGTDAGAAGRLQELVAKRRRLAQHAHVAKIFSTK